MSLDKKVAIVTGGSTGIGRAICLRLAGAGADIAFNYLCVEGKYPASDAEDCAKEIRRIGRNVVFFECDSADPESAERVVKSTLADLGRVDILINNAGIASDDLIWNMSPETWKRVLNVNLGGAFNFARAVAPIFKRQKSGRIIAIASINALRGKAGQANYTASKAAVIGLIKSVAKDLGRYNVTANVIAPGWVDTTMTRSLPSKLAAAALAETALQRFPTVENVAACVEYLCSDEAGCITGTVIPVDSGQLLYKNGEC